MTRKMQKGKFSFSPHIVNYIHDDLGNSFAEGIMMVTMRNLAITGVNETAASICREKEQHILGKHVTTYFPEVNEHTISAFLHKTRRCGVAELSVKDASGLSRTIAIRGKQLTMQGDDYLMLLLYPEFSSPAAREEPDNQLTESTPVFIALLHEPNGKMRILHVNQKLCQMLAINCLELNQKPAYQLLKQINYPSATLRKALKNKHNTTFTVTPKSSKLNFHTQLVWIANNLLLVIARPAQKGQQNTNPGNKSSHNTTNEDSFSYWLSFIRHELKNPLSTLTGFAETLHKSLPENSAESKKASIIFNSALRINDLVDNLTVWAESKPMEHNPEKEYTRVAQLTENILQLIHSQALNKNITIVKNIEDGVQVYANKNMLEAIIRNLLTNALKFTQTGGRITFTAYRNGDNVWFEVKDTGLGMSKEETAYLLQDDVEFTKNGTFSEKGSGLGLKITREFIKIHASQLHIKSTKGKGTRFYFALPDK